MTFAEFMWGVATMIFGYTLAYFKQHLEKVAAEKWKLSKEKDEYFAKIKKMSDSETNPFNDWK